MIAVLETLTAKVGMIWQPASLQFQERANLRFDDVSVVPVPEFKRDSTLSRYADWQ